MATGTLQHLLVIVDPDAATPYTPGDTLPIDDAHLWISSKRRVHHPWIAQRGSGRDALPDIEVNGERLEMPLGRVVDGRVGIRVIDEPAPVIAVSCDVNDALLAENTYGLGAGYLGAGGWAKFSDQSDQSWPPNSWWQAGDSAWGGSVLFFWVDQGSPPYTLGTWVRSSWIEKTLDGTEAGGAAWTPGQKLGWRFRVNWSLDTGPGNLFVELQGATTVRVPFPNGSYDFWDIDPSLSQNVVDTVIYVDADPSGQVKVLLGGENYAPSGNTLVDFQKLEVVSCDDAITGVDETPYVTGQLADVGARQRQLGRLAYLLESDDEGATWPRVVYAGFVKRFEMERSKTYLITLGDTRRAERHAKVWQDLTPFGDPVLSHLTDVYGGILGGFADGLSPDRGYRTYTVLETGTDPAGIELPYLLVQQTAGPTPPTANELAARANKYFVDGPHAYSNQKIRGSYPRLAWYLLDPTTHVVVAGPLLALGYGPIDTRLANAPSTIHAIQWMDHTTPITGPYLAVLVSRDVTAEFPLHLYDHPVDIIVAAAGHRNIAVDSTSAAAVKAELGAIVNHLEVVTNAEETFQDLVDRFSAGYGFSLRINDQNEREFFRWRRKNEATPSLSLAATNLRAEGGPTFLLDDQGKLNRVRVRLQTITPIQFDPNVFITGPANGLTLGVADMQLDYSTDGGVTADAETYGESEVTIDFGGTPAWPKGQAMSPVQFADGLARKIFDLTARGIQEATVVTLRETDADSALIGDEIELDIPHLPNAQRGQTPTSQRGGPRPFCVQQRNVEVPGVVLRLFDQGTGVPFPDDVEITVDEDGKNYLIATIANADVLQAAGAQVEFEVHIGDDSTPPVVPGFSYWVDDATAWPDDPQELRLGPFPVPDSGEAVWVRARAWYYGGSAGVWSSNWEQIPGGTPPPAGSISSLTLGTPSTDGVLLSWTNTHPTDYVLVQIRETGTPSYRTISVPPLAAGSTGYRITGLLPETDYDVRVVLSDPITGAEEGSALTDSFTTDLAANQTAVPTPTNAAVFNGYNPATGVTQPGIYGLEVTAVLPPAAQDIVFEEAVETAVGSGTPGSYAVVATIPAVAGDVTRYTSFAPNDGLLRYLRAYATAPGYTDSGTTTALSVDPWDTTPTVPSTTTVAESENNINANRAFQPRQRFEQLRLPAIQHTMRVHDEAGSVIASQVFGRP